MLTGGAYCRGAQDQEHAGTDEAQSHQVSRPHHQVLHDMFACVLMQTLSFLDLL